MRNLPEFDAIIHLAGKAHDTKNRSAAQAYFDNQYGIDFKRYLISFWNRLREVRYSSVL